MTATAEHELAPAPEEPPAPPARAYAALSGVLAVAVTLGVTELVSAWLPGGRSLVIAVGDLVIDTVPGWFARLTIDLLGTADKPFLIVSILVTAGLAGAALGLLGARRLPLAAAGIAGIAAVGAAASLADPQATGTASLAAAVAGAGAGIATLVLLLRAATPSASEPVRPGSPGAARLDRARFLGLAGAAVVVAGLGALGGRMLSSGARIEEIRGTIRLPRPDRAAAPPPSGAELGLPGLSPAFTPNDSFYRIDTALVVPRVDPAGWSLRVEGLVDRPFELAYSELMDLPQIEADVTIACVSNEVGGDLVGNARWQGVPLRDLLERAGLRDEATQVLGRSVDGFTAGFPTSVGLAEEDAMVAVAMNGVPLPTDHGFPARLIVPGLYGYVSATKWLAAIELTRFDEVDGYWIPRGWAKEAPIKTQSRIDLPARSPVPAGRTTIAGVAWAPTRGIERVEVRVDEAPWEEATLAASLGVDSWRQWFLRWDATPGKHLIAVRATDGEGDTQTARRARPDPDGATGHHTIEVTVE